MSGKDKYWELDFIRAISIIAVVVIHSTASIIEASNMSGFIAVIFNQLSRFSVPAFLIVSGILAFRSSTTHSINVLWRKRVADIVVPYLVWSTIGLLFSSDFSIRTLIFTYVFGQGAFYQLYYIVVLIQFYLLLPIFVFAAQNIRRVVGVCSASCLLVLGYEMSLRQGVDLGVFNRLIQCTFIAWMGYFVVGCYIGKNYKRFIEFINNSKTYRLVLITMIISFVLISDSYYLWGEQGHDITEPLFNFFRIDVVVFACVIVWFLFKIGIKASRSNFIKMLYDNSFGIYLSHLFILILLQRFFNNYLFGNSISTLFTAMLILLLSLVLTQMIKGIPIISQLFLGVNRKEKVRSTEHNQSSLS